MKALKGWLRLYQRETRNKTGEVCADCHWVNSFDDMRKAKQVVGYVEQGGWSWASKWVETGQARPEQRCAVITGLPGKRSEAVQVEVIFYTSCAFC